MDAVRTAPGSRRSRTYTYALHGVGLRLEGDDPSLLLRVRAILEHFGLGTAVPNPDPVPLRLVVSARRAPPLPDDAREIARQDGIRALGSDTGLWLDSGAHHFRLDLRGGVAQGWLPGATDPPRKDLVVYALLLLVRRRGLFALHASAVVYRGAGYLFVAGSGSGKSTITYTLVRGGWDYLADDALLLRPLGEGVEGLALRRDLCLDPVLATRFPEVAVHGAPGPFAGRGKHRLDMRTLFPHRLVACCRPQVLLFPEIAPLAKSRLVPLAPAEMLPRLIAQSAVLALDPETLPCHLAVLGRLAAQARGYRLLAGRDVEDAPERVVELLEPLVSVGSPAPSPSRLMGA